MIQKIRFIQSYGFSDAGDEVEIVTADDRPNDIHLYYYDHFERWCSVPEDEEGIVFEWVEKNDEEDDSEEA